MHSKRRFVDSGTSSVDSSGGDTWCHHAQHAGSRWGSSSPGCSRAGKPVGAIFTASDFVAGRAAAALAGSAEWGQMQWSYAQQVALETVAPAGYKRSSNQHGGGGSSRPFIVKTLSYDYQQ